VCIIVTCQLTLHLCMPIMLHACYVCRPGGFCGLRLLPGAALEADWPALKARLAESLIRNPPHGLEWLRNHPLAVCVKQMNAQHAATASHVWLYAALQGLFCG
jgi:hypothetical protein